MINPRTFLIIAVGLTLCYVLLAYIARGSVLPGDEVAAWSVN